LDIAALFLVSFLAATLFPAQSELMLAALLHHGQHAWWLLISVALCGNVLGSCVNWLLGRYLMQFQHRRWFPFSPERIENATQHYQKWGVWSLLLAWLPIIGDALTLIAGLLRTPFALFLLLVTIGKAGRYAAIALAIHYSVS